MVRGKHDAKISRVLFLIRYFCYVGKNCIEAVSQARNGR